ncbi:MAG TPA: MFS transporter [Acidimicrobiales bacterium]|nr:MFS transporter [Acidimicrobiales bacterium]
MDAPISGSAMAEAFGNAFRLSTDRQRHGQEAFSASPFSRLLITHVLSLAGDALVTLALAGSIFFSTNLHAARGRVALTLLVTIAPFAVVAPLLGPIIDRTTGGRRAMVVATALGRAVACFLMARYINSFYLYPAAFLTLVGSKGYTVAKATLVPAAVERPEDLVEANSKLAVSGALAGFLIAIPGVAILKLASAVWVLRLDTLLFLVCAATALRLQVAHPSGADVTSDARGAGAGDAVGASSGDAVVKPLPPGAIQVAAFAMGTLRLIVGFLTFLVAFGFRNDHAPAWWYGVVLAGSIGGNLVGAAVAPWLRSRLREELILAGSTTMVALAGIVALLFNAVHSRPAAGLLAGVVGLSAGAAKLSFDALVQRHIPAATQGRAFGRFEAGFQLVWVLGGLLPVLIAMTLPVGFAIITLAAAFAAAVYVIGTRLARQGRLPDWWPGVRPPARARRLRRASPSDAATVPVGSRSAAAADPDPAHAGTRPNWTADPADRGSGGRSRGGLSGPGAGRGPAGGRPGAVVSGAGAGGGPAGTTGAGAGGGPAGASGTGAGPVSPYGPTVLFDQVAGADPTDVLPTSAPPYDGAYDYPPGPASPPGGGTPHDGAPRVGGPYDGALYDGVVDDEAPWMSSPPRLGTYPPPIDGPPPLGQPVRPVPPPLAGPPPIVAPLAQPPRPPADPPAE